MLSPPASNSGGLWDSSSCSSDTGDVLVRSTRVLEPGSVQITVQKLRDAAGQPPLSEQQQRNSGTENRRSSGTEKQQRPKLRHKPDIAAPPRASADSQPGHDVLTSRFAAGGRGVVLAALKQRSHSAPNRREVKVQLLNPGPLRSTTSSQNAPGLRASSQDAVCVQTEAELSSGRLGDATNAAAAAAAAARLIKAQSDMEARVSQLADGVERLLQADRESVDRGRGLSQQKLQHLETLHSHQLQLQSQLLESALRIVTGHVPVTSTTSEPVTASSQPACLQVTHLDAAANVLSKQQPSSSATRAATLETGPVSMATPHRDRWPEQTRNDRYLRGVSTATEPADRSHLQSSANHGQAAARRANEVLKEMRRLKTEMEMLLMPEDSLNTTPATDPHRTQQQNQSQSQQNQSQSQQNHLRTQQTQSQSQQNQFQSQQIHSQTHQNQSQTHQNQSQTQKKQSQTQQNHHQTHQNKSQSQQNPHQTQQNQSQSQQNQSQTHQNQPQIHQNQSQTQKKQSQTQQNHHHTHQNKSQSQQNHHQTQQNQSQSQQNQSQTQQTQSQQSRSVLVQRRPVVPSTLEEAGLVLRQVQRQKKVLEENLDSLLRAKTGEVLHCQLEALAANRDWTEEVRIKKTVDAWINTLSKDIQAEMSSEDAVHCRPADAASKHSSSRDAAVTSQQMAAGGRGFAHTGRGRPVSTLRGTGRKTAAGRESRGQTAAQRQGAEPDRDGEQVELDGELYLTRLYGRAPYDGLRRTLKKSPYLRFSSPASPLGRKSRPRLVESVRGVKVKSCKTQTSLAPPVSSSPGRPQSRYIFNFSHLTSGDPSDLAVTPADSHFVPMAIPLGRPRIDSSSRCPPSECQQEVASPPTAPPTTGVVAVDSETPELHSQEEEQLDAGEAPPSSHTVDIAERKREDEEDVFPGTDFLSVTEVVQEEVSVVGEEPVELDGDPSPPPVLYQGPVFPPQARSALPAQEQASVLGPDPQRDTLENRLVEWVEQQLMSRMISEMYRPPPADPAQNDSTDQSEPEEQSFTSDIVEAAGGGGLQLFVDSSMLVDSALIRQLVNEVLTETVALMLGHRDAPGPETRMDPPKLGPVAHQEKKLVPLVPTPVPTPPSSPVSPSRETTPLITPPPSEPTSLLNEKSSQPITAPELVDTPIPSPEPAPSGGSPPAVYQAPPPLTWGDAELPLDEERPEEHLDTHTQPLVMSVAEEEPPLSTPLPHPLPPLPPRSLSPPPAPEPRPASSSSEDSSSSSSSETSSSSSAVTAGTDAALKHISEGELLISVNQLAAMTEEEAVCSFSSSLQELQDMDFDPPSEGQIRGHDLLLTLLTKMEQGVTHTHRGERPQPEGSWGRKEEEEEVSVGEVKDNHTTKPHRTTKPRRPTVNAAAARWGQTSSPGQISQSADVSEVSFEATNQSSVTLGDLMVEPSETLTSDLHSNLSLSPPPHLENTHTAGQVVLVRRYDTQTAEQQQQQGGTRRMDVCLPSIRPEEVMEEEVMEEEDVSAAADSDSSTNNVF